MNVVIVPGYGDRADYLETASKGWQERFGLEPHVVVFGWSGEADSFDLKWEQFSRTIQDVGETAIIGISAGASVAIRAMQTYPDTVKKVVTICGPVHPERMNRDTLRNDYPVLERSLDRLSLSDLPAERVMTLRPLYDDVVNTKAMYIDGAVDKRMCMIGHPTSILWAMYVNASRMSRFITS